MANREITKENQETKKYFSMRKLGNDMLIVLAAGIFIGFLSPFGMDSVPVQWSIAYWIVACAVGYFIYTPVIHFFNLTFEQKLSVHWHRVALATIVASVLMSFAVPVLTWLFFDAPVHFKQQFMTVFPKAIVIGGVITFFSMVRDYINNQQQALAESSEKIQAHEQQLANSEELLADKLIQQLPIEKRGQLLCLEMSDHYLKVYTDKGHHLILMRFKDAMELLAEFPGMQTHRSWWVANAAIASTKKDNRKLTLVLTNGVEVPVSRTYLETVKSVI